MAKITYAHAETVVRVSATAVAVTDPFLADPGPHRTVEGLEVEVATVADDNDTVSVELVRGDRELAATLTPDGRLQSIEYNSVGVGGRVVTGLAKVVAFVGSLVLAIGGRAAEGEPSPGGPRDADAEWAAKYPTEAGLLAEYKTTHTAAAAKLQDLRDTAIETADLRELRALTARIAAVERVRADAAAEVARITQLKAAWIEGERTRVSSELQTIVRFADIAHRSAADTSPPTPPTDGAGGALWRDFGLVLEERPTGTQTATPTLTGGTSVTASATAKPVDNPTHTQGSDVRWRVPRETELWVWTQGETDHDDPVLVSRETIRVSDHDCRVEGMPLTTSIFGTHGGALTFGDDGRPVSLRHTQESALGALIDALGTAPETVAGAVGSAKTAAEGVSALVDMKAARALADAERRVDLAKKKLELAGVEATAADYAALQQAEQALKLQTARQGLAQATGRP